MLVALLGMGVGWAIWGGRGVSAIGVFWGEGCGSWYLVLI